MSAIPPTIKVTLDLLITRSEDDIVTGVNITSSFLCNCDHFAVHCQQNFVQPPFKRKNITNRKLKSVDIDSLRSDVMQSSLIVYNTDPNISFLIENYESTLF